jgi:hypothetical protein
LVARFFDAFNRVFDRITAAYGERVQRLARRLVPALQRLQPGVRPMERLAVRRQNQGAVRQQTAQPVWALIGCLAMWLRSIPLPEER